MRLYLKVELSLAFFTCYSLGCLSQELTIGDACPNVRLTNYSNGEAKSFSLSDLKSKLIIIDFWGTGCTSCIKAFPKIDSLKKKFGNQIQFILVNQESADSTKRFLSKRNKIKAPNVSMVMGDSVLNKLFPHFFVPHHVWLDDKMVVRYITDGENATAKNIANFLSRKDMKLAFKKDMTVFDDLLVSKIPEWKENVLYYSALSHHISGLTISNGISSTVNDEEPNKISCTSSSISQLFQRAFAEGNKYNFEPANTVILNVKDKWKFTYPEDIDQWGEWFKSNAYYYELLIPPTRASDLYKIMQKDLLRYFEVDVRVEKRKIRCLLFVSAGNQERLRTKGGKPETNFWRINEDSIQYIRNQSFERIRAWITGIPNGMGLSTPVIDLVEFRGNIDFEIERTILRADPFNLPRLRKVLQKYGLDLIEQLYLTDVLVISDKKRKQE
jgi:thiol-disulfide isomerase/thioredoxin